MNNKAFTISLGLAALAVFMIYSYITSKETELQSKFGNPIGVVVATKDIGEMEVIHKNLVDVKKMPAQFVQPGKTTSPEEVIGFIASVPIRKGEQVTLNKIIAPGVRTGLARQVTPGKRAMAIRVSDEKAVNRLLKPGDRIDLIVIAKPDEASKIEYAKYLMQDVPILSVGEFVTSMAPRREESDDAGGKTVVKKLNLDRNFNTITIEVDPQAVPYLVLSQEKAVVHVVLRHSDDTDRLTIPAVSTNELLGGSVPNTAARGTAGQK